MMNFIFTSVIFHCEVGVNYQEIRNVYFISHRECLFIFFHKNTNNIVFKIQTNPVFTLCIIISVL